MKTFFVSVLAALAFTATAQAAEPVASCKDYEVYRREANDQGEYQKTGWWIAVFPSNEAGNGYVATIFYQGQAIDTKDVTVETGPAAKYAELKEIAAVVLPTLKWEHVAFVREAVVNPKAQKGDGGGASIFELLSQKQVVLGRLGQIGWSVGRCS